MGALELREELYKYITMGDKEFLAVLYKTAEKYIEQKKMDRMIFEGEKDIKAGHLHSQEDVKKMVEDWMK